MRVGFVGLGKLGYPIAAAMSAGGHEVLGYDIREDVMTQEPRPYAEAGPDGSGNFNDHLPFKGLRFGSLADVVHHAEVIFVAVQTPHEERFGGTVPIPDHRRDFDYQWIADAAREIAAECIRQDCSPVVAVISTMLPGTMRREIIPLFKGTRCKIVYNPFFIAMGTVWRDYLKSEFVLLGQDAWLGGAIKVGRVHREAIEPYSSDPTWKLMSIESAELTKVAYNTFISTKIAFANTIGEVCEKIPGADADEVTSALKAAGDRLVSPRYMTPGMGDGGGCHPRDNIAMSWLARELDLSFDWFSSVMMQRERHAEWLAGIAYDAAITMGTGRVVMLGYAFKPETSLTDGSPALLVGYFLQKMGAVVEYHDPWIGKLPRAWNLPHVVFIGCRRSEFTEIEYLEGSVIIDPFRYMPDRSGVTVHRIGEGRS